MRKTAFYIGSVQGSLWGKVLTMSTWGLCCSPDGRTDHLGMPSCRRTNGVESLLKTSSRRLPDTAELSRAGVGILPRSAPSRPHSLAAKSVHEAPFLAGGWVPAPCHRVSVVILASHGAPEDPDSALET